MKLSISRYNPEHDEAPYLQDYEIELTPSDHMLLDVLIRLKAQDHTLTLRKSCREGICGSDAMNIVAAGANMPNFSRFQNADGFDSKSIASR